MGHLALVPEAVKRKFGKVGWLAAMEVYKNETKEIIRRFLAHRLSFPSCLTALDDALASFPGFHRKTLTLFGQ